MISAVGGGVDIGLGQHGTVRLDGILIPGALARVEILGHLGGRKACKGTIGLVAVVDHGEFARQKRIAETLEHIFPVRRFVGDIGDKLSQHHAGGQPVGNTGRGQLAGRFDLRRHALGDRAALQRVDIDGKAGKGRDDGQ
jgi:hypothetical protein